MFDSLSANVVNTLLPNIAYEVPGIGSVDLTSLIAVTVAFFVLVFVFWFLRRVVLAKIKSITHKIPSNFDDTLIDALENVKGWVFTLIAFYIALQAFNLPVAVDAVTTGIFYLVLVWQAINIATRLLNYFTTSFIERSNEDGGGVDPNAKTASQMITLMARITLWVLGALFVLSNLGVEVTSLIAGLGIGGIAIAFALQGVLGDLFASLSIYLDKPFRIGDFIVVGSDMGTVEKVGIKSTRIRTLQGEELVISNTELTSVRVQNFKKMEKRRVVMRFGVTYDTPQQKLREIPVIITRIFEVLEGATLDRAHFASFGDSALIYEMVYFVESSDYNKFMDIQQEFNFDLIRRFAEVEISFAYPTQTIYTKTIT